MPEMTNTTLEKLLVIKCPYCMTVIKDNKCYRCSIYFPNYLLIAIKLKEIVEKDYVTMGQVEEIVKVYTATMDKLAEALNKIDQRLKRLEGN